MKRLLWLGAGLAVGALVVRKLTRKANEFTPSGIATSLSESAGGLVESLRSFVEDVRDGMAEREHEIHEAFAAGEYTSFDKAIEEAEPGTVGKHSQEGRR